MTDDSQDQTVSSAGDRRGRDRRKTDRRQGNRRAPTPVWRRPWALVAYGVLGALLLIGVWSVLGDDEPEVRQPETVLTAARQPNVDTSAAVNTGASPENAFAAADYERLIAEGGDAAGRRVRVELFCTSINSVALRESVEVIEGAVAALADAGGRVPAAECKWGQGTDVRREDFALLVPPALAEKFASAPEVEEGFIRRRRITGVVEWLGRSEALALRPAGVLRSLNSR